MLNKTKFLFSVLYCLRSFISMASVSDSLYDTDEFDVESTMFSKMETIKTWVADKHQDDKKLLKRIQRDVAMTLPQNLFHRQFIVPVENNAGDTRYFGKTMATLAAIELPFLQFVKEISQKKQVYTLEIGAADGLVSWKVPLAFSGGSIHCVNDLSNHMLENFMLLAGMRLEGTELKKRICKISGDCLSVFKYESFKSKFSAIYVQNVEHFFNPVQHQEFLTLISELLEENGQAYLSSHSFGFGEDTDNPLRKVYQEQKSKGDVYPGFAEYVMELRQVKHKESIISIKTISASRPDDNVFASRENLGVPVDDGVVKHPLYGIVETQKGKTKTVSNAYSPSIYRKAISLHPSLEVLDSFFIARGGIREDSWNKNISHAAVILKKKPQDLQEASSSLKDESFVQDR